MDSELTKKVIVMLIDKYSQRIMEDIGVAPEERSLTASKIRVNLSMILLEVLDIVEAATKES